MNSYTRNSASLYLAALVLMCSSSLMAEKHLHKTNIPGVMQYDALPKGFDLLKATDQDIADYGFPRRPKEQTSRATWEDTMSKLQAHHARTPSAEAKLTIHPSSEHSRNNSSPRLKSNSRGGFIPETATTSSNWAGGLYIGGGPYWATEAMWSIPQIQTACPQVGASNATFVNTWAGLGGWTSGASLVQAGAGASSVCQSNGTTDVEDNWIWFEWWPNGTIVLTDNTTTPPTMAAIPGQWLDVVVTLGGSPINDASYWITNKSTYEEYAAYDISIPEGFGDPSTSAECIVEAPNYPPFPFADFIQMYSMHWNKFMICKAFVEDAYNTPVTMGPLYVPQGYFFTVDLRGYYTNTMLTNTGTSGTSYYDPFGYVDVNRIALLTTQ